LSNASPSIEKLPSYGGQALIEGVLMRGAHAVAAAMRGPDGKIVIHSEALTGIYTSRWIKIPFLRGLVALWDALGLGMRFLTIAANLQSNEDEKLEGGALTLTMAGSLLFAMGLFFALPAFLGHLTELYFHFSSWWSNLAEGLIRLGLVVGYIWLIGRMPEIQRVFAYHGAEHKTINAYEAGVELTVENVGKQSLEHPRCGTAFLLTLVVISIIVFTVIGPLPAFWRVASRVIAVPLLAGVAYEYIRWTARHLDSPLVRLLIRPNLALQSLTTRQPDASIVEVAITAFNAMLEKENELAPGTVPAPAGEARPFASASD
jgi:uncharacterized protein YqhQ